MRPGRLRAGYVRSLTGLGLAALLLASVTALLYAPVRDAPFIFDDPNTIVIDPAIRSLRPLSHLVSSGRPLTVLSFAVDYARGGLDPRPYHCTSLLLHVLNGLLLYVVVRRTVQLPGGSGAPALKECGGSPRASLRCGAPLHTVGGLENRSSHRGYGAAAAVALGAALLFVVHPLQTESVAYVSSRSEVLAATFYLLGVWLYVSAATAQRRGARAAAAAALPLATAAALASKEMAVTLPPALLLYDWCFLGEGLANALRRRWWLLALAALPAAVGGGLLLQQPAARATAGFGFTGFTPWQYLLTQFGVVLHYLRLTVFPAGLCFDYDWPLARSPWSAGVLLPFACLSALAAAACLSVRRRPLFAFAVLWTFLLLAPTSSFMPIADVIAERRMYLALAGPALLAAAWAWQGATWLCGRYSRLFRRRAAVYVLVLAGPALALSVTTAARARLWADPLALHLHDVAEAPGNPRLWMNLGVVYIGLDRVADAHAALARARLLYDQQRSLHAIPRVDAFIAYNFGVVLYGEGRDAEATAELDRALAVGGEYYALAPKALFVLGEIAARQRRWPEAAAHYRAALSHDPSDQAAYLGLARAQIMSGALGEARATLKAALSRAPQNAEAAALLARLPER
jgi:tetratricopeptide (TPR) repeat protein